MVGSGDGDGGTSSAAVLCIGYTRCPRFNSSAIERKFNAVLNSRVRLGSRVPFGKENLLHRACSGTQSIMPRVHSSRKHATTYTNRPCCLYSCSRAATILQRRAVSVLPCRSTIAASFTCVCPRNCAALVPGYSTSLSTISPFWRCRLLHSLASAYPCAAGSGRLLSRRVV
jgi:hypothetical protein